MYNTFNAIVEHAAVTTIAFNPAWANGTGYFDNATLGSDAPEVAVGEIKQSQDNHGRKIIFIGMEEGNAVIFQRYNNRDLLVGNFPYLVEGKFFHEHNLDLSTSISNDLLREFCAVTTDQSISDPIVWPAI